MLRSVAINDGSVRMYDGRQPIKRFQRYAGTTFDRLGVEGWASFSQINQKVLAIMGITVG